MSSQPDLSQPPGTPTDASFIIDDTVARPLSGAALFYALYWLVEIEGVAEAAFDFRQHVEAYWRGFYWYGIFSSVGEASSMFDKYYVDGWLVNRYLEADTVIPLQGEDEETLELLREAIGSRLTAHQLTPALMDEHINEVIGPDLDDDAREVLDDLFKEAGTIRQRKIVGETDRFGVESLLQIADLVLDVMDDPEPAIEAIGALFSRSGTVSDYLAEVPQPDIPDAVWDGFNFQEKIIVAGASGWRSPEWNGPGWAGITDHLMRRGELSKTAWVDQSWSIEHNNRNWLDKISYKQSERDAAAEFLVPDIEDPNDRVVRGALIEVLDAAQEGDIERVFDAAVLFNDAAGVNLRRQRRLRGI